MAFNLNKEGDSKYCNNFHVMEHHEVIKISVWWRQQWAEKINIVYKENLK